MTVTTDYALNILDLLGAVIGKGMQEYTVSGSTSVTTA